MPFRPLQIPKRPLQPIRLARGVCLKLNFSPLLASAYKPKSAIRDFSCKKSDYSRRCHRYNICILTQYVSFVQFQDEMKAKFSNDRFGIKADLSLREPRRMFCQAFDLFFGKPSWVGKCASCQLFTLLLRYFLF